MVARVLVLPLLFEPLIFHPPILTVNAVGLNNSINSSFAPFVPRVRNSLMTICVAGVDGTVGVAVFVVVPVGVAVRVVVAVEVVVRVGVCVCVVVAVLVAVEVKVEQTLNGDAVLRGFGAPIAKSALLLSVSVQPFAARKSAFVLLGAGA